MKPMAGLNCDANVLFAAVSCGWMREDHPPQLFDVDRHRRSRGRPRRAATPARRAGGGAATGGAPGVSLRSAPPAAASAARRVGAVPLTAVELLAKLRVAGRLLRRRREWRDGRRMPSADAIIRRIHIRARWMHTVLPHHEVSALVHGVDDEPGRNRTRARRRRARLGVALTNRIGPRARICRARRTPRR